MQTREQVKNWKVVASVATVAALGVSGLAVAGTGDPAQTPPPIEISDQRPNRDPDVTSTSRPKFEVVPAPAVTPGENLDSPLASADLDSPDTGLTGAGDSPDDSPDPAPTPAADDSADDADSPDAAPTPPADDSPDVADSPVDSPVSVDSADSGDSLDS